MPNAKNLKEQIDAMAAAYLAKRGYVALVIGIYQHGKKFVKGFGKISGTNGNPPDVQTIFEIGSITKVFTATVLAQMAEDGLVKLEDSISLFLPQGVASPAENGREITLKDLAAHTSGLPRMPENFKAAIKNRLNSYAHYSTKDLYDSLATVHLSSKPGKTALYSNYGYGLLGKILELRTGKAYGQLIHEYICAPLGLENTVTQLSTTQKGRLTPGHSPKGQIVPNWDFDAMPGCGAIRSNAEDLLKFIEANLGKAETPIAKALNKTHECIFKKPAGSGLGLGWGIHQMLRRTIHCHSGATGGYVSFVGFEKAHQTGAVLLSNYADAYANDNSLGQMGMQLTYWAAKEIV
jgi:CubicO group peptidase (beta-lactamase class C family)